MYIIILSPHILLYKISLRFQKKRFFSALTLPKVKDTIFGDEERNFCFYAEAFITFGRISECDPVVESWLLHTECLEQYLAANDITEADRK